MCANSPQTLDRRLPVVPPRAGANSEPSTARSASPPASPAARSLANRRPSLPKSSLPSASASLARRTACLKPDSISPAIPRLADCAREVRRDNAVSTAPTPCGPARPLKLRRTSTPARLNSPTSPFAASRLRSAASATAPRSSASSRACARAVAHCRPVRCWHQIIGHESVSMSLRAPDFVRLHVLAGRGERQCRPRHRPDPGRPPAASAPRCALADVR